MPTADDTDALTALRARLAELRADALRQMVEALPTVDCGLLRLVADTAAVLAVLDDEAITGQRIRGW